MANSNTEIEPWGVTLTNDQTKPLNLDSNTQDAPTQSDSTLQTDGYATSPDEKADPMATSKY